MLEAIIMNRSKIGWLESAKFITMEALFFFFLSACLLAQSDTIRFKHLTGVDGLSQEVVNCILKDKKGFMWFGTQDGLNRYDGLKFKIYKNDPKDFSAICDKRILCLHEDQQGTIWIGTMDGGLNRFNRKEDTFRNFKDTPIASTILRSYDVKTICETPDGVLWIGTKDGLDSFNPRTWCGERISTVKGPASRIFFLLSKGLS